MKTLGKNEFNTILVSTQKGREYSNLILEIQKTPLQEGEKHHIHPRALGGSNDRGNLITCTPFDHCRLHALLALAVPCKETLFPVIRMSSSQCKSLSDLEKTSLDNIYQWSKSRQRAFKELHKLPFTEERLQKMSDSHKGKSTSRKGQHLSESHKEALRKAWAGKPKPWLRGKSTSSLGKIWINKDGIGKRVFLSELEKYEDEGWIRGCVCKQKKEISCQGQ